MTGNIHGRLNRSLEGTVKLIKLLFMDFAPAVTTGLAAIVTIFMQLPFPVACMVILVIPVSRRHIYCLPADQHTKGYPCGTDGYQGRYGRHHGGTVGRY